MPGASSGPRWSDTTSAAGSPCAPRWCTSDRSPRSRCSIPSRSRRGARRSTAWCAEHPDVFAALPPHIHAAVADAYVRSALAFPVASDVLDALVDPWRSPAGQAALYRQIAQGDERDTEEFRERLAALGSPALILWGEADPWIPVERGRELARLIPHAELHTIAGAGHLVQEDAPGAVLQRLLPFLSRARGG
jgi:pimeloyl-ACP methyl ester carboxylesterase